MANVSRTIAPSFQSGILAIVLLQSDFAADPVTVQVFYTDDTGAETLASEGTAQVPSTVGSPGNRLAALADIPAAQFFRVVADNGVSAEPLDLELIYGAGTPIALSGPVVFVQHESVTRSAAVAPDDTRDVTTGANNGAMLSSVIQNPASILGTTNRVFSRTPLGALYLVAQHDLPAPGGIARRAAVLAKTPGGQFYRCTTQGDPGATVGTKYGVIDSFYLQDSPGGAPVPIPGVPNYPASVSYVATNGDDATGQRGSIAAPFATVQGAIDASNPEDTILVAPGSYGLPIVAPDFDLSIIGQGNRNEVALGGITWNPTGGSLLYLANIEFASGTFQGDGVTNQAIARLDNCSTFGPNLDVSFLSLLIVNNCQTTILENNCDGVQVRDSTLTLDTNIDEPTPGAVTPGVRRINNCRMIGVGALIIRGNANVEVQGGSCQSCEFGPTGNPTASLARCLMASVSVASFVAETLFANQITLSKCDVSDMIVTHTGPDSTTINAKGSNVEVANLTSAGGDLIIDTRGGYLNFQASFFSPDAYWRRQGGGSLVTMTPGIASYSFQPFGGELLGQAYPPADLVAYVIQAETDPIYITGKNSQGFTANNTSASNQETSVVWSYVG